MGTTNAKRMDGSFGANLIANVTADSFDASSTGTVNLNNSGTVYYYVAIKAICNDSTGSCMAGTCTDAKPCIGSYSGNGIAKSPLSGMSWSPEWVMVASGNTTTKVYTAAVGYGNDLSFEFTGGSSATSGLINAINTDGFSVGTSTTINGSGNTYHWIASNSDTINFGETTYCGSGNGTTQTISGLTNGSDSSWPTEYVIAIPAFGKQITQQFEINNSPSQACRGTYLFSTSGVQNCTNSSSQCAFNCSITNMTDTGFVVGTSNASQSDFYSNLSNATSCGSPNNRTCTAPNCPYYAVAFTRSQPTRARLLESSAERVNGGVLVRWQTKMELDNLGFEVYREQGNTRKRATSAMIAGSALMVTPRTMLGSRQFAWLDRHPHGGRYWVQAIATDASFEWYGPISVTANAVATAAPLSPTISTTASLHPVRLEHPEIVLPTTAAVTIDHTNWDLPAEAAIKLRVRHDGWQRVSLAELRSAGLDPSVETSELELWVDGHPVRRHALPQAIEFYGEAADTLWTDAHVYWLAVGKEPLEIQLMPSLDATQTALSFPHTVVHREREFYVSSVLQRDGQNWFGSLLGNSPLEEPLTVHHLAIEEAPARLSVFLQGVGRGHHRAGVQWGNQSLGEIVFDQDAVGSGQFEVPATLIKEGTNPIRFVHLSSDDLAFFDELKLTYAHQFAADLDQLRFTLASGQRATVAGFTHPVVRAFDITEPRRVSEIPTTVVAHGKSYDATVAPALLGTRTLLAVAPPGALVPDQIQANQPSLLRSEREADLLIVAHHSLLEAMAPLVEQREREGLVVDVVDIEDVQDEFNFGQKSPQALKQFLRYAKEHWRRAPRYVLLVGDATLDPRNYKGFGKFDLIPTYTMPITFLETASDDWFADFDEDGLPEMALGRLPVRTPEETAVVVKKIVAYSHTAGDWQKRLLMIEDHDPKQDFDLLEAHAESTIPGGMEIRRAYRRNSSNWRQEILSGLSEGQLLVNYIGHGSQSVWANEHTFSGDDALALNNGDRLPFVISMTCLTGLFHDIYGESLAESLLRAPHGGALAVWASTSQSYTEKHGILNETLLESLLSGKAERIGDGVLAAKAAARGGEARRSWVLLGDPSTRLSVPQLVRGPDAAMASLEALQGCSCQLGRSRTRAWIMPLIGALIAILSTRKRFNAPERCSVRGR